MNPKPSLRTLIPRLLNMALWLSFCAMAGTGLLLALRMPPGSKGGQGLQAWGMGRHEWGDLHTWISYAFIACILLHLYLHWRWLWQVAARKRAWPLLVGLGAGLLLTLFLVFQPVSRAQGGQGRKQNQRQHQQSGEDHP